MKRRCREVIENIDWTKEEAEILYKAEQLYGNALLEINLLDHDKDLIEACKAVHSAICEANARTNVHITCGDGMDIREREDRR